MPNSYFNSDEFHKGRVLRVRVGDIVLDSGWKQYKGFQVQVVATAGVRTADRSNWFQDMVFGGQNTGDEGDKEVE